MELREKTDYVLGLPGGTQIGWEHGEEEKNKDYDHPGLTVVKDSMFF